MCYCQALAEAEAVTSALRASSVNADSLRSENDQLRAQLSVVAAAAATSDKDRLQVIHKLRAKSSEIGRRKGFQSLHFNFYTKQKIYSKFEDVSNGWHTENTSISRANTLLFVVVV